MAYDWGNAIGGAYKGAQADSSNWMDKNNSGPARQPGVVTPAPTPDVTDGIVDTVGGPQFQDVGKPQPVRQPQTVTQPPKQTFQGNNPNQAPGSNIRYRGA